MTRSLFRPVLIALMCAGLAAALGGCGRKGGLDLPPQAQSQTQAQASAAPATAAAPADDVPALPGSIIDQTLREADPPPLQRSKRKFILDPLLSSD